MRLSRQQKSTSVSDHQAQAETLLRLRHATTRLLKDGVGGAASQINTLNSVIDETMATMTDTDQVLDATTTDSQATTVQGRDKTIAIDHATDLRMTVGSVVATG